MTIYHSHDPEPEIRDAMAIAGFEDTTWHNDTCASFSKWHKDDEELGIRIWVEARRKCDRDNEDEFRFAVVTTEGCCTVHEWYLGDDMNEAIRIAKAEYVKLFSIKDMLKTRTFCPVLSPAIATSEGPGLLYLDNLYIEIVATPSGKPVYGTLQARVGYMLTLGNQSWIEYTPEGLAELEQRLFDFAKGEGFFS